MDVAVTYLECEVDDAITYLFRMSSISCQNLYWPDMVNLPVASKYLFSVRESILKRDMYFSILSALMRAWLNLDLSAQIALY